MTVEVSGGKITAIQVDSSEDAPSFFVTVKPTVTVFPPIMTR